MRTALDNGVKGGKWFSLVDKVYQRRNLEAAFKKVKRRRGAAGVDHQTVPLFERQLESNLDFIATRLKEGTYRPQALRRVWIEKPGSKDRRPLGIPTVRDRVVQTALLHVLQPIFERYFASQSYGFRPGRGCKDALRRVDALLKSGQTWVVDADIKSYFDSIPHAALMGRVEEKIADGRVMELIRQYLKQGILEGMREWEPDEGTPQGAVISPLLANIYLDPLDHQMADTGYEMVRYADDFVVLCRSEEEARAALKRLQGWMHQAGLSLHPEKTRIVDTTQPGGFDFLGYHFERGHHWPREKSLKKLKDSLRQKTKRNNGHSFARIIQGVNQTVIGWFAYFKHSTKSTFPPIDQWLRMRLRSILRKRRGRRGRGRGADHQRWPNAFFTAHGLFSLSAARASLCPSSKR
jgi:RNA-directed DNA polymerase